MVKTSGSFPQQQHSPLGSFAFRNCMIAPVENRQHEFLPVSVNPFRVPANLGWNGLGFSGFSERGLTSEGNGSTGKPMPHPPIPHLTPKLCSEDQIPLFPPRVDEKPSTCEAPSSQQKRFLIFDQSGNETRLIFSPLCPRVQNLTTAQTTSPGWNQQAAPAKLFGAYEVLAERPGSKVEQAWSKTPALYEESGENEILDDGSEMREDTEELNALLYCDYDDDDLDDYSGEEDEVSSGHSPLPMEGNCEKQERQDQEREIDFEDEVASSERSSKRQKACAGGYYKPPLLSPTKIGRQNLTHANIHGEDLICALEDPVGSTTVGSKRPRMDKICDTLKVLESIIPGMKSKDPVVILDEAINYLKCLKYNAETMFAEDTDISSCYGSDHWMDVPSTRS